MTSALDRAAGVGRGPPGMYAPYGGLCMPPPPPPPRPSPGPWLLSERVHQQRVLTVRQGRGADPETALEGHGEVKGRRRWIKLVVVPGAPGAPVFFPRPFLRRASGRVRRSGRRAGGGVHPCQYSTVSARAGVGAPAEPCTASAWPACSGAAPTSGPARISLWRERDRSQL
jgi:hypothetical protein